MDKITRHQWRGTFRLDFTQDALQQGIAAVNQAGQQAMNLGNITALCIYRWHQLLFVYTESIQPLD